MNIEFILQDFSATYDIFIEDSFRTSYLQVIIFLYKGSYRQCCYYIYNWGFPLLRNAYVLQNDKNTSSYDTTTIVAQHYCLNMITCSYLWYHSSNIVTMRRV